MGRTSAHIDHWCTLLAIVTCVPVHTLPPPHFQLAIIRRFGRTALLPRPPSDHLSGYDVHLDALVAPPLSGAHNTWQQLTDDVIRAHYITTVSLSLPHTTVILAADVIALPMLTLAR